MPVRKVVVDESVHAGVVDHLDRAGFDVVRVPNAGTADSWSDGHLLGWAVVERRVVVTTDPVDFLALNEKYHEDGRDHPGIIVGRQEWAVGTLCRAFENALLNLPDDALATNIVWADVQAPASG